MAESVYEGLYILDANAYSRDPGKLGGKLDEIVKNHQGEVLASRLWEERRLAYPIKGQKKGVYWLSYFRIATEKIADLYRECEIDDSILRALILKVEPRLVETMLAHAQGKTELPEPPKALRNAHITGAS